jgi:hypothetical protein
LLRVSQYKFDLLARHAGEPFSNSAGTGTRVFVKSHSPLTFPGVRSTAAHVLQSSMCGFYEDVTSPQVRVTAMIA